MKKEENRNENICNIAIMIFFIFLYRFINYLPVTMGLFFMAMPSPNKTMGLCIWYFIVGMINGFIVLRITDLIMIIRNRSYSIVYVKKNKSHEICAKIKRRSRSEIVKRFEKDIQKIKKDYNKPGSHLTTRTHTLFTQYIIKEFIDRKGAMEFYKDFSDVSIGTRKVYESEARSVVVEYYKDQINSNNAINKFRSWSDIKEASKKVPFYNVKINIK